MKAGILTFHSVTNIGAVLQAYALNETITQMGFDAKVINYRPAYIFGKRTPVGRRPYYIWNNFKRQTNYKHFYSHFLPITDRVYYEPKDLQSNPPNMDVYICGSDQVWNLKILKERFDPGYFLDFVSNNKKRIAYAPSFGDTTEIPISLREKVIDALNNFDALSVREESGRFLLKDLLNKEVPVVLDPCFLIRDYSQAAVMPQKAPDQYIAVYYLDQSKGFRELVRRCREKLNLPVVNISPAHLREADINHIDLGPHQWLGWMKNASFVCTNSFHGTVFSLIFRKNFLAFSHQLRPKLNTRIVDLLSKIGLSSRFLLTEEGMDTERIFYQDIDYCKSGKLLDDLIETSSGYLRSALSRSIPTG